MMLRTIALWGALWVSTASGLATRLTNTSVTHRARASSCSGASDWGTQGQLLWWSRFFLNPSTERAALMLPSGNQTPQLVTDTIVCTALRNRIDAIATAEDSTYQSFNLNRSIVVMAVDTVYVTGDPLHANFDRRRVHYVFSAGGVFLKEFRLVQ